MSEEFKVKHASVTPELAARFADELEVMIGQVMNGKRRADRLPVEHMIGLIQFSRCASPSPASDADERAAFEAWANSENWICSRDSFNDYYYETVRDGWSAWQARAASTRTASDTRTAAGEAECDAALGGEA